MKRICSLFLAFILIASLTACGSAETTQTAESAAEQSSVGSEAVGSETAESEPTESESAESESGESELTGFYQKLSQLDGVSSVEKIEQEEAVFAEKYMVTFTQPIDWDNLSLGTFEQRVEIGYNGDTNVNCFYCGGYVLKDKIKGYEDSLKADDRTELVTLYNGNYINIEYRFFGDSVPEGLSNDKTDLWEYLTVENAAKDFKSIIEKLGTILTGRTTFAGRSKGGFTTNTMAYYYPDLCDAYVAYAAPLCDGTNDLRAIANVYETIGDLAYSSEEAAALRQKSLDFQVLCIENREELQEMCWKAAEEEGCIFRDFVTKEILFDILVIDMASGFWQYGLDFNEFDIVLSMPDTNDEEHAALIDAAYSLLTWVSTPNSWSTNVDSFPYSIQMETEMGNYTMDFSYLREAVIEKTGKDMLAVTEDMQEDLWENMFFTDEQKAAFQYDDTIRNELIAWSETTDAHIIMIYGNCDFWYPERIPDTDNPNVHIFVQNGGFHSSSITGLSEEDNKTCMELLNEWLG